MLSEIKPMSYQQHVPSIGVVIGSNNRRFCFRRRRFSCSSSEPKPLRRVNLEKFSAVGKECTRLQERKDRAKYPTERMDTFMEKASRIGPAAVGHKRILRGLCQELGKNSVDVLHKSSLEDSTSLPGS
jgi:hypothetical protein